MNLHDTILRHGLLVPGDRVLCALSGGPDSVCMTHALCALREELPIEVAAAHFSHGLRPEKAEDERRFCETLCDSLHIPLFCGTGDTPAYARSHRMGAEEAARALRYDFLDGTATAWSATKIATAHTQNDQAETVLFHLIRGGGARGLSGIPISRGRYIRPLLETSRAAVERYLAEYGLAFVTDESNADLRYARNRLRQEALPLLELIHPGAHGSIASAASLLACDDDCLTRLAAALTEGNRASASGLARSHPAVAGRAVRALYRAAGGQADLYRRQTEAVLHLCASENPSGRLSLPGGYAARREYDTLVVEQFRAAGPDAPAEVGLTFDGPVCFGEWEIELHDPAAEGFLFPRDVLVPALKVRTRRPGDRIVLSSGSRSLKQWMIDRKMPREQRALLPVICGGDRVLAVADLAQAVVAGGDKRISITCRRIKL